MKKDIEKLETLNLLERIFFGGQIACLIAMAMIVLPYHVMKPNMKWFEIAYLPAIYAAFLIADLVVRKIRKNFKCKVLLCFERVSLKGQYKVLERKDDEFYAHLNSNNTLSIISIIDWRVNYTTISMEEYGEMFENNHRIFL